MKPRRPRKASPRPQPPTLFAQPPAAFYTLPEIELRGGYAVAYGCRRVLTFTPESVCVDTGQVLVTFYGSRLRIESLVGKRLMLAGEVTRIEFLHKWPGAQRERRVP